MTLRFAPLAWTYHDGWRYFDSKTLRRPLPQGGVEYIDHTKSFYQKGHCHLFLPDVDTVKAATGQMYWGQQTYSFSIVDEWGPNSDNPYQSRSYRLIGKPIWYFRIEEYWRRMYVQPWDSVDMTCTLPLNQEIVYDDYDEEAYRRGMIEKAGRMDTGPDVPEVDLDSIASQVATIYGFTDYLECARRTAARRMYVTLPSISEEYEEHRLVGVSEDASILHFMGLRINDLYPDHPVMSDDDTMMADFMDWYQRQYEANHGYVSVVAAMRDFMDANYSDQIEAYAGWRLDGCKYGEGGRILVPRSQTIGHVGIRYDASLPCHSLGPFMEGGDFYFFSTVVNRTMPCEYWLDEMRKTRQYYLKRKESDQDDSTSGGQTWTFAGDSSKFVWVSDVFEEARQILGNAYEDDTWYSGVQNTNHGTRYPYNNESTGWVFSGMNSKRLPADGDNAFVRRPAYDWSAYDDAMDKSYDDSGVVPGYYDEETGWHSSSSSWDPSSAEYAEERNAKIWQHETPWGGWYETDEVVRTAHDGRWYSRTWSPVRYEKWKIPELKNGSEPSVPSWDEMPCWNRRKRRAFPNPSPWLCVWDEEHDSALAGSSMRADSFSEPPMTIRPFDSVAMEDYDAPAESMDRTGVFARTAPYVDGTVGENHRHILHFEYARYYKMTRRYDKPDPVHGMTWAHDKTYLVKVYAKNDDESVDYSRWTWTPTAIHCAADGTVSPTDDPDAKPHPVDAEYIPYDWETCIEDWNKSYDSNAGASFTSIDEEDICFSDWIARLGEAGVFDKYHDRWARYTDDGVEISAENGYVIDEEHGTCTFDGFTYPLPDPVYTVSYESDPLAYVTFAEFQRIWSPLTAEERIRLRLDGDMPVRNSTPYPSNVPGSDPPAGETDEEFKARTGFDRDDFLAESAPTLKYSAFFPRHDDSGSSFIKPVITSGSTSMIMQQNGVIFAPYESSSSASPLNWDDGEPTQYPPEGGGSDDGHIPYIDPFRNGTVDPIENWKRYFSRREKYTIPEKTIVRGDRNLLSPYGNDSWPTPHPRETAYSCEDGARNLYPDDKYTSPIIEYQRIIRKNGTPSEVDGEYYRLPGMESEEDYIAANWLTAQDPAWGDGFSTTVTIPYRKNGEVQSPFSGSDKMVRPIGEYCHGCVEDEDKMRYHLELYDSLDQIQRYDFPTYYRLMMWFTEIYPSYAGVEDYNDYSRTVGRMDDPYAGLETDESGVVVGGGYRSAKFQREGHPYSGETWNDIVARYWGFLDSGDEFLTESGAYASTVMSEMVPSGGIGFSRRPVVRHLDAYGNDAPPETFADVALPDGTEIRMWREDTTGLMPRQDQIEYDNDGAPVRGKVVEFSDPHEEHADGRWVEQCLGAIVKAKVLLVFEDLLGHRWKRWVDATALKSRDSIIGSDHDAPVQ